MPSTPRLAFVASKSPEGQNQLAQLTQRYGQCAAQEADVIVALGGDGFMLQTLHRHLALGKPVYGMKAGTVGFLMNQFRAEGLPERIASAKATIFKPLEMLAITETGSSVGAVAFNEVSLLRQTKQAAKIRICLDGQERLDELVCDGILVSTPAGSTAYNLSAHGPILPLGSEVLAMTPISPFRPRRWRGAILPSGAEVRLEILEPDKRPVSATADSFEVRDVAEVIVREAPDKAMTLLFDPEHSMEQRILDEQFTV
ncbi:MAG: NAD kinase [Lysobacteraceae bacterium]